MNKKHLGAFAVASITLAASAMAQTMPATMQWSRASGAAALEGGTPGASAAVRPLVDLPRRIGYDGDSWWFSGYAESGGEKIAYLFHTMLQTPPQSPEPVLIQSMAVTNMTTGQQYSDNQVYPFAAVRVSDTQLSVVTPTASLTGSFDDMHLVADTKAGKLDLHLRAGSPALINSATGTFPFLKGNTNEFAVPVMSSMGQVTFAGKAYKFAGNSWFDRQWSPPEAAPEGLHWAWSGINLPGGESISVWSYKDKWTGKDNRNATILHADGSQSVVAVQFIADEGSVWRSPSTGNAYPIRWTLKIPQLDAVLKVSSVIPDQEIVAPALGAFYQGVSEVTGVYKRKPVKGVARLELLGKWQ